MRLSEFTDKQIMDHLSTSKNNKASFNFFNPDEDSEDEFDDDDHRSFDFHSLADSHSHRTSLLRNCSSMDHVDSVEVAHGNFGMALVSKINLTIKEHFENLLHSVDGLSARLSQIESKTRQLENSVDDLKVSAEYNNGRTDGKLRQLENIMREVQDGIHFLRDRQEIAETQLQLAKLQGSKISKQSGDQKTLVQADSLLQASSSASEQSPQPQLISGAHSFARPTLIPDAPSTLPYQNSTPAGAPVATQPHTPIPQNPIPSALQPESYLPAVNISQTTYPPYNVAPTQQVQPPPVVPSQFYQSASNLPQVPQSPQLPQLHPPIGLIAPQTQPPWTHHLEETPLMPSHNYQQNILQSFSQPPDAPPTQQFYMDQQMEGQPLRRPNSEFPAGYSHTSGPPNLSNMHPYSGSPSLYSSSTTKPYQISPSSLVIGGGSNYTQLPKAQILPRALPTASNVDTGSSSGRNGNKVAIDDVVDNVTAMGFRRDLVRATVKKLTENGQSVDLNAVLDKLMNNNGAI